MVLALQNFFSRMVGSTMVLEGPLYLGRCTVHNCRRQTYFIDERREDAQLFVPLLADASLTNSLVWETFYTKSAFHSWEQKKNNLHTSQVSTSFTDPDLDPAFHVDADDSLLRPLTLDPDPAPHQSDGNLQLLAWRPSKPRFHKWAPPPPGTFVSLHDSIVCLFAILFLVSVPSKTGSSFETSNDRIRILLNLWLPRHSALGHKRILNTDIASWMEVGAEVRAWALESGKLGGFLSHPTRPRDILLSGRWHHPF